MSDERQQLLDRLALLVELRAILDDALPSSAITSRHLDALSGTVHWQRAQGPVIVRDPPDPLPPIIRVT